VLKSDCRIALLGDLIIGRFDQLLASLIFVFLYELFRCHPISCLVIRFRILDRPVSLYIQTWRPVNDFLSMTCRMRLRIGLLRGVIVRLLVDGIGDRRVTVSM